jgi:ABC-2 type transport system permease protein
MSDSMSTVVPQDRSSATRPVYWSIRRELWENRSLYMAPLIVAAVFLFGFLVSVFRLPAKIRALEAGKAATLVTPYSLGASMILLTGFIVGMFYCLDALNGERRDRSILFWKSMPVSDRQTVLSKAAVPWLVLPLLTIAIVLAMDLIMLLVSTLVLMVNGINPVTLWTNLPLPSMTAIMFYGVFAHVLWFAPIHGWFLLISAWAKRAMFLWAVLPFLAAFALERIVFGTSHGAAFLKYRFLGTMMEAFSVDMKSGGAITRFAQLTPLRFLSTSSLWLGMLFAAMCVIAAVRLRRNREPI